MKFNIVVNIGRATLVAPRKGRVDCNSRLPVDERAKYGRAPRGARGLKWRRDKQHRHDHWESRPARGAWIEISCTLIVALLS